MVHDTAIVTIQKSNGIISNDLEWL